MKLKMLADTHIEIISQTKANEILQLPPSTQEQLTDDFEE